MTTIKRRPYPRGEPTDDWTVGQLRRYVTTHKEEGVECLACGQWNKVYRRRINHAMAVSLLDLYRLHGKSYGHAAAIYLFNKSNHSSDVCKLRFWGILEEEKLRRPDGARGGYWRVTDLGEQFILGSVKVPEFAYVYNNRCLESGGRLVDIHECLPRGFDYAEVMRGRR